MNSFLLTSALVTILLAVLAQSASLYKDKPVKYGQKKSATTTTPAYTNEEEEEEPVYQEEEEEYTTQAPYYRYVDVFSKFVYLEKKQTNQIHFFQIYFKLSNLLLRRSQSIHFASFVLKCK
jgi:hypothetical protein